MAEAQRAEKSLFSVGVSPCLRLKERFWEAEATRVQKEKKVRKNSEVRSREEIGVAEFETVRRERCDRGCSRDRDQVIFHHCVDS